MSNDDQDLESLQQIASRGGELPLGAHLVTRRRGYVHHGIYAGNGEVMHYVGFKGFLRCGPVEKTSLAGFANGHGIETRAVARARYVGAEAVRRAASRLGEDDYRLLTNNCEHFCTWCLFGEGRSQQVEALLSHPWRALPAIAGILFDMRGGRGSFASRLPAILGLRGVRMA
ncbi:lecithin retinol acyltransferase family protein [Cupriavidus sp. WKF15]|uniref:lecithin retinol acyltransferase family protein n=1 Tax=Cupriavidus sp. WKF15 TaxID=3032282 RepID=UPI0023E0B96A|nr:lecithin retinol acyltransferase family protein [Cupriavidus sp. WKF15]WER50936.1 lecithin retinol acyltransferase family protein [Cupriavidus sp. WKF15]